jgi:phosphate transport system permease protein
MMSYFVRRKLTNHVGTVLSVVCVLLALIPLGAMLTYVVQQGASSLSLSFFTNIPTPEGVSGGGMANAITGTLMLIALASIVGLPIGLLTGVFLARAVRPQVNSVVRFVVDIVAGTPSIVAGIVAYAVVVIPTGHFSAVAGGLALGLLMFPTVTRATEEAIKLVPVSIREAGLALGLPEWQTMLRVVIPAAANGIVTAIMLGIARVAGETAPLIFTTLGSDAIAKSPFTAISGLPQQIWVYAQTPYADQHRLAWAGAFVLFSIVLVINIIARLLTRRLTRAMGTAS